MEQVDGRKWDGTTMSALYLTAILHRKDLSSIRDLNSSHIPLLTNIREAIVNATTTKWPEVSRDQLRLYFHCTTPPPPNPPFLSSLDTSHGRPPFILPHAHPRRPHRFQRLRRHGHRKSMAPRRNTRTIILPGRRRIQIEDNDNNHWRGIRSMEERI